MQFTAHTDMGLRILLLLGAESASQLSTHELAERHGLSQPHVAKVVQSLALHGFVETSRGRGGGVRLAKVPADIRVGDVVRALEPHMNLVECFQPGSSACRYTGNCGLTHVLVRAKNAMLRELDSATLEHLLVTTPHAALASSS